MNLPSGEPKEETLPPKGVQPLVEKFEIPIAFVLPV
jgi:hypothetical protein